VTALVSPELVMNGALRRLHLAEQRRSSKRRRVDPCPVRRAAGQRRSSPSRASQLASRSGARRDRRRARRGELTSALGPVY
jgi:hypothetical protein